MPNYALQAPVVNHRPLYEPESELKRFIRSIVVRTICNHIQPKKAVEMPYSYNNCLDYVPRNLPSLSNYLPACLLTY